MQESLVLQKGLDGICNVLFELSICHIVVNINRRLNIPIFDVVKDKCFQPSAPGRTCMCDLQITVSVYVTLPFKKYLGQEFLAEVRVDGLLLGSDSVGLQTSLRSHSLTQDRYWPRILFAEFSDVYADGFAEIRLVNQFKGLARSLKR